MWNAYDVKASWVAVFLLFLFWWLTHFLCTLTPKRRAKTEEGVITVGSSHDEDDRTSRLLKVARHFRDGLLFLLTAVTLDTVANGPYAAANALTWIFTGIWLIIGALKYFTKWDRLIPMVEFFDLILLVALISNAFAYSGDVAAAGP